MLESQQMWRQKKFGKEPIKSQERSKKSWGVDVKKGSLSQVTKMMTMIHMLIKPSFDRTQRSHHHEDKGHKDRAMRIKELFKTLMSIFV